MIQDALLSTGLPVILGGIIVILLEFSYLGILRLITIRDFLKTSLSLTVIDASNNLNDISSEPIPVGQPIRVKGRLEYTDNKQGLANEKVRFDNGQGREDNAKIRDVRTDETGNFISEGITPLEIGTFEFCAHFNGGSKWSPKLSSKKMKNSDKSLKFLKSITAIKRKCVFKIEQKQPSVSNSVFYTTRLRKISISVFSGYFKNEEFVTKDKFRPSEVITFLVELKDNDSKDNDNDRNKPIRNQSNIELLIFTDKEKITKHLPTTDNDGRTYVLIVGPKVPSDAWTYQAFYNGDGVYEKASTPVKTYSTLRSKL
jgi:hypothetical protein